MTGDQMVGWHHQFNGHEFEQILGDGEGQRSLVCCSPWGRKESDTAEQWNKNKRWKAALCPLVMLGYRECSREMLRGLSGSFLTPISPKPTRHSARISERPIWGSGHACHPTCCRCNKRRRVGGWYHTCPHNAISVPEEWQGSLFTFLPPVSSCGWPWNKACICVA